MQVESPIKTTLNEKITVPAVKVKYCLYARKSTESEERQILSIDSQIKEMLLLADREGLEIVSMKRESHSAKETGQRPVFNEIIEEIKQGKYNGILTWAPDRISRNAGDLGQIVDLMDSGYLLDIRTFGQQFGNNPNEKFLLMILGSQAKLENFSFGLLPNCCPKVLISKR
ncbi:recombinase family protein [Patescibacteria group bacterium]|nr:recombinase family protein [Patescibacteria group bacterium]